MHFFHLIIFFIYLSTFLFIIHIFLTYFYLHYLYEYILSNISVYLISHTIYLMLLICFLNIRIISISRSSLDLQTLLVKSRKSLLVQCGYGVCWHAVQICFVQAFRSGVCVDNASLHLKSSHDPLCFQSPWSSYRPEPEWTQTCDWSFPTVI